MITFSLLIELVSEKTDKNVTYLNFFHCLKTHGAILKYVVR